MDILGVAGVPGDQDRHAAPDGSGAHLRDAIIPRFRSCRARRSPGRPSGWRQGVTRWDTVSADSCPTNDGRNLPHNAKPTGVLARAGASDSTLAGGTPRKDAGELDNWSGKLGGGIDKSVLV